MVFSDGSGASGNGTGTSGSGGGISTGSGGNGIHFGDGGDNGDAGGPGTGCKMTCEVGECGPVADGCGHLIECGGCTAPETCGGGGEASKCGGDSGCVPKTCDELGAECGQQSDGCGGVVDCWASKAKKCADLAQACIDGVCTDTTSCTQKTCADYSAQDGLCGPVSDGCGGTLQCGLECAQDEICGVTELGKCGKATCEVTITCDTVLKTKPAGYCGFVPDNCGNEIAGCATPCTGGETCGGGGVPDVCGKGTVDCEPKTTADCGNACGQISDGCGGTIQCAVCTGTDTCGGGDVPGVCGSPACVPRTCAQWGANCQSISDGCGGTIASCGTCASDEICNANLCIKKTCTPKTAAQVCTGKCGPVSDGCDSTVNCGGCTGNNTCGGGGTPSVCGSPPCTPLTCQALGANCGPIGDGCGGTIPSCGTCTGAATCGGGGPSKCGVLTDPNCTGLCPNVKICPAGSETRLSGTVYAPNGTEPLYNALVYVPNAPIPPISTGPSCGRCEDEELGSPLAAALTGADGKFVLKNVPAGVSFPVVVKMGKWRRVITMPAVTQCTNVNLTVDQSRLPRHMTDAAAGNVQYVNIPKTAMVTGDVDEMECVLRKIGVDDREFTLPSGSGRIHLYRANGAYASGTCTRRRGDGTCRTLTGQQSAPLVDLFTGTRLDNYDLGIFDCEGSPNEHNSYDATLRSWAERGGRAFASHYSYTYLHDNGNFKDTATWGGNQFDNGDATTGILDTVSAKGKAFNAWLGYVNAQDATYGSGYIHIDDPRGYVQTTTSVSERFVYTDTAARAGTPPVQINQQSAIQQYAFNTPVGANAANICGRVLYSGFHVADATGNGNEGFPEHCASGPLTPQEKVLEFMIFDLSACVSVGDPPPPPSCKPKTCAAVGATCGPVADGCGGLLNCGTCTPPASCGGGGVANQCGSVCKRTSCGAKGANCGIIADGCGGTLTCGVCTAPAVCGGGGTANVCGVPQCQPRSCASVGASCGPISDGCGGTVNCGTCPTGTCGGGGTPNVCGTGSCNPKTCAGEGAQCGFIGDGCGGTVACGMCATGQICGAAGPNKCGGGCTPRTCADAGADCGFVGNGCGGVLNCGVCVAPQICGGGGVASKCGGSCSPRTCAQAGATCGGISDGCGNVLQCGVCPPGQTCGGGGVANQCGSGSCTPRSCAQANAECGAVGDGCGGIVDCGMCVAPNSCGGAGIPNKCGMGTGGCVPRSCAQQNADCGPVADGCGGLLDCGVCATGFTCGGGGVASKCGGVF